MVFVVVEAVVLVGTAEVGGVVALVPGTVVDVAGRVTLVSAENAVIFVVDVDAVLEVDEHAAISTPVAATNRRRSRRKRRFIVGRPG